MGRHSVPDEEVVERENDAEIASPSIPAVSAKTSAVADLQLVLHNPRLLFTCMAAVSLPFAIYFIVLMTLGRLAVWPVFIGAPMVLAGILVGAVLDHAYHQLAKSRAASASVTPTMPN
jgi:hypothetical protein